MAKVSPSFDLSLAFVPTYRNSGYLCNWLPHFPTNDLEDCTSQARHEQVMNQTELFFLGSSANDVPLSEACVLATGRDPKLNQDKLNQATDFFRKLRSRMKDQLPPDSLARLPESVRRDLERTVNAEINKQEDRKSA